jgi:DNA polymerase-3 subunit gamma/tau
VSYKVLARKWRPQRFDDVIGQRAVTQTLRNAIGAHRIAQSFVFAGPRGVGKTTTARILARGLNCQQGPTADPCGTCDACVEIAEGRDMDVLEIDAATHTQVDKVRDIIISGLGIAPVRDRHKVFIIDEVHRLSQQSFDALLKSIEEPPPHVVFMMATTELDKVPATIQSRSQVFELKTIGVMPIAEQLIAIAAAEQIQVDSAAIMLIARAGDGSMRDAQSAFDQVIAFAGTTITAEDVATVLGLVRRDLLLDMAQAVAQEDGAAVFALADRAVEGGYELRTVLRELGRLTRDLLVVTLDPSRLADPEIAAEGERDRLKAVAALFSPEDLLRAFDVLIKGEYDIRTSMQPRFHLEMTLLRWIHLRKLVPLSDLIDGLEKGTPTGRSAPPAPRTASSIARGPLPAPPARTIGAGSRPSVPAAAAPPARPAAVERAPAADRPAAAERPAVAERPAAADRSPAAERPAAADRPPAAEHPLAAARPAAVERPAPPRPPAPKAPAARQTETSASLPAVDPVPADRLKEAFLEEVRKAKKFFYGTVIAQAQRIDIDGDKVIVTFGPQHRTMKAHLEQTRPLLETIASQLAGRRMSVVAAEGTVTAPAAVPGSPGSAAGGDQGDKKAALREQALADSGVQAMLDVFAAEIKDVEEM